MTMIGEHADVTFRAAPFAAAPFFTLRCVGCGEPVATDDVADPEDFDYAFCAECLDHGRLDPLSDLWDDLGVGD